MWQKLVVLCLGSHHGSQKQVELSAWQTVFGSSKGKDITTYSKSSTPQTRDWEHPSKACEIMRYVPGTCQTLMLFWPLLISLYYIAPKWCYVSPNAINRNGGKKFPAPDETIVSLLGRTVEKLSKGQISNRWIAHSSGFWQLGGGLGERSRATPNSSQMLVLALQ